MTNTFLKKQDQDTALMNKTTVAMARMTNTFLKETRSGHCFLAIPPDPVMLMVL